jgi:hypothetical protein
MSLGEASSRLAHEYGAKFQTGAFDERLRKPRISMPISRRRLIASLGSAPALALLPRVAFAKYHPNAEQYARQVREREAAASRLTIA